MKLYSINLLFILLLQIIFHTCFAQSITYKCYLKSGCSKDVKELEIYELQKSSFHYYSLNKGAEAILPDTGIYILKSSHIAVEGDSILIHIIYGVNIDTIKQRDIVDAVFVDSKPLKGMTQGGGWFCCGKPCEGYKIDYYENGEKLMEGKFKKGKPVGDLKFYNESGKLNYVEYYNKRGRKLKSVYVKT